MRDIQTARQGNYHSMAVVHLCEPRSQGHFNDLKDDIEPGQLNSYYTFDETLSNKELSNGRLAMLASLGYIAQELVTQQAIF